MALQNIDPPDPLIGTLVSGRYRVVSKLGEGGMGRVYEAQHELIGKRVALKCLNAEYATHPVVVERFKREARAATAVGNEHIVDVTDLGDLPDGSPFIVMEHLEGRELADLINEGPLTLGRAVRILDQVCDALHAAHAKGIVHRDLKPENIFLIPRGGNEDFVKVLDFGISKMREPERPRPASRARAWRWARRSTCRRSRRRGRCPRTTAPTCTRSG
jgi:serine/threonine protein kinase